VSATLLTDADRQRHIAKLEADLADCTALLAKGQAALERLRNGGEVDVTDPGLQDAVRLTDAEPLQEDGGVTLQGNEDAVRLADTKPLPKRFPNGEEIGRPLKLIELKDVRISGNRVVTVPFQYLDTYDDSTAAQGMFMEPNAPYIDYAYVDWSLVAEHLNNHPKKLFPFRRPFAVSRSKLFFNIYPGDENWDSYSWDDAVDQPRGEWINPLDGGYWLDPLYKTYINAKNKSIFNCKTCGRLAIHLGLGVPGLYCSQKCVPIRHRAKQLNTFMCAHCGTEFTPKRRDAKTCSMRCRVALHRREKLNHLEVAQQ
jgi:hypothetical protein